MFDLVKSLNFLSSTGSKMAFDVTNKPFSIGPQSEQSPDIDLNKTFPTPTAKVMCQTNTQTQNDSQQKPLYYSIFDPPKLTLKKSSTTPTCQVSDQEMAAEIAQYDEDMYAALEAEDDSPLSDTMKALANRFISLCDNDFALTGPISATNTQQRTTGSDTMYNSSLAAQQVPEYGPDNNFDNDDKATTRHYPIHNPAKKLTKNYTTNNKK